MHDTGQRYQASFEAIRRERPNGEEYWSARELAGLLEYETYRSFFPALMRARQACASAGRVVEQHFLRVVEMEESGSGRKRKRPDMQLSRLGCYLVVQNADPVKHQVALCQHYLLVQTRRYELVASTQRADALQRRLKGDGAAEIFLQTLVEGKLRREGITSREEAERIYQEAARVLSEMFPGSPQAIRQPASANNADLGERQQQEE